MPLELYNPCHGAECVEVEIRCRQLGGSWVGPNAINLTETPCLVYLYGSPVGRAWVTVHTLLLVYDLGASVPNRGSFFDIADDLEGIGDLA